MAKKKKITKITTDQDKPDAPVSETSPKAPSDRERVSNINFDRYQTLFLALLILVGSIIYSNTLHSPFVLDDMDAIVNNSFIRMQEMSARNLIDAAVGYGKNRPVAMVSFALNYYFDQYNLVGYHLVNIFIHVINSILLFFLVKLTLALSNQQTNASRQLDPLTVTTLSFFTALLWLANPLQTQSVTYIVQRMNSMGALFYLLALILYAKGRLAQRKTSQGIDMKAAARRSKAYSRHYYLWYLGCVFAGVLALGCKESSASLPFFIFLYEWYFFQHLDIKWFKRQLIYLAAIGILLGVVAGLYLGFDPASKFKDLKDYSFGEFSIGQRLLTQARVVVYYLSLIFYPNPSRLNLDHDFPLSYSLFNPVTTLLSLVLIVGLIALGVYLARKKCLLSFCIFWFLGNLVIESSVIPLAIIYEHRLYLPSMSVFALSVILAYRYIRPAWLTAVTACVFVTLTAYWTFERNNTWRDPQTIWTDCVRKSPNKTRPLINLGKVLTDQNRYDEAIPNLLKAIQINPNIFEAHHNLGFLYEKQGETDKAIEQYREAIRINPYFVNAHNNLGNALLKQDKPDEAIISLQQALGLDPDFVAAHINMGVALAEQNKLDAAVVHFNKALQIDSNLALAQFQLGSALVKQGRIEQGISHIKKALQIDPDYAEAHNNLGGQLLQQGKLNEAFDHLTRALSLNPDLAEAHNNAGIIQIQQGNLDAAINHFQDAVRIKPDFSLADNNLKRALAIRDSSGMEPENIQNAIKNTPDDPQLHFKMGNYYLGQGELPPAIAEFERALTLRPDFLEARNNLALAYAANRQYEQALAAFKKLIELDPANAGAYYNIAVLYALQNKVPAAIDWLKQAVDKGYQNWRLIKNDKDLANIRDSAEYRRLVEGH